MALEVTGHLNLEAMSGIPYSKREEEILFKRLNRHLGKGGYVQCKNVAPLQGRDKKSMSNHWQHMKRLYHYNGKKWVLKQPNLFEGNKTQPKKENARKTPQNAPTGVLPKRVVVKKSFLWGAFTFERYE